MGTLQGKTFSITGKLSRGRKIIVAMIEKAGGKYIREISGKVDYVIANPDAYDRDTAKLDKAQSLGLSIIDESHFMRMLNLA